MGETLFFCNDQEVFKHLDQQVSAGINEYLAVYREERDRVDAMGQWRLLGIEPFAQMKRDPFLWPKKQGEN
jgi:hypothetical protein